MVGTCTLYGSLKNSVRCQSLKSEMLPDNICIKDKGIEINLHFINT